jgi:hypothetical protein
VAQVVEPLPSKHEAHKKKNVLLLVVGVSGERPQVTSLKVTFKAV